MEITLDTLTQHDTKEPVDMRRQNVYGYTYVPKDAFHKAMDELGLEGSSGYGRAVRYFRGVMGNLHVEVVATAMCWNSYAKGDHITHYKVHGYIPESVHIKGKGRDKYAWSIFRLITKVIEKEWDNHGTPKERVSISQGE